MIFTAAATLASNLAANGLLENLLAVKAVAITHQAAPDQNRIRPFCPETRANPLPRSELVLNAVQGQALTMPPKKSPHIETIVEFLYRLSADGTTVHQTGRTDVHFHRHRHCSTDPVDEGWWRGGVRCHLCKTEC
jgi:hypothetical protein